MNRPAEQACIDAPVFVQDPWYVEWIVLVLGLASNAMHFFWWRALMREEEFQTGGEYSTSSDFPAQMDQYDQLAVETVALEGLTDANEYEQLSEDDALVAILLEEQSLRRLYDRCELESTVQQLNNAVEWHALGLLLASAGLELAALAGERTSLKCFVMALEQAQEDQTAIAQSWYGAFVDSQMF